MKKEIKTKRLVLKPFSIEDYETIKTIVCDPKVNNTYMLPDFQSEEQIKHLFQRLMDDSHSDKRFVYGIYYQHQCIGFINDTEIMDDTIEVGYVIQPKMQNQGFASEVLTHVIQELFQLGFHVVKAGCFEENIASQRVMEKSGMKRIDFWEMIPYKNKQHRCIYYEIKDA